MAERLDAYEFKVQTRGQRRRYPWGQWFDGAPWRLTSGEDFQMPVKNMARLCRMAASRRSVEINVNVVGQQVVLQRVMT